MRFDRALLAVVIAGCGDSVQPGIGIGTYQLLTIQGHAPPQIVVDAPDCRITVIGGTLALRPDHYFELLLQETSVCPTPTGPGERAEEWLGTFTIGGNTVILHAVGDPSTDYWSQFRSGRLLVPLGGRFGDVEFIPPS